MNSPDHHPCSDRPYVGLGRAETFLGPARQDEDRNNMQTSPLFEVGECLFLLHLVPAPKILLEFTPSNILEHGLLQVP